MTTNEPTPASPSPTPAPSATDASAGAGGPVLERTVLVHRDHSIRWVALLFVTAGIGIGFGLGALAFGHHHRGLPPASVQVRAAPLPMHVSAYRYQMSHHRGPQLGVVIRDVDDESGAHVVGVVEESAARHAGIEQGDVIVSVDGASKRPITNARDLVHAIREQEDGATIEVELRRGSEVLTKTARLR